MALVKVTLTEALAELKTLEKRIASKQEYVAGYLTRMDGLRDPLSSVGGSVAVIAKERQALKDLQNRYVAIRTAIQRVNQATPITILDQTKSISEWLSWKKDVAPTQQAFLTRIRTTVIGARATAARQGASVVEPGKEGAKPNDLVINLDEAELAKEHEELETVLGTLDGQLSLKNATVTVEV